MIMASSPITSCQIDGKTVEIVADFVLGGAPKSLQMVTAAMKLRCLLLGRKAMTNLDSIFKSRDVTLQTKAHIVKAVFSSSHAWMSELDHKDSFEMWFWRRLLRIPWTARRSNQSILK